MHRHYILYNQERKAIKEANVQQGCKSNMNSIIITNQRGKQVYGHDLGAMTESDLLNLIDALNDLVRTPHTNPMTILSHIQVLIE